MDEALSAKEGILTPRRRSVRFDGLFSVTDLKQPESAQEHGFVAVGCFDAQTQMGGFDPTDVDGALVDAPAEMENDTSVQGIEDDGGMDMRVQEDGQQLSPGFFFATMCGVEDAASVARAVAALYGQPQANEQMGIAFL
jgi:hypothetical protein